MGGFFMSFMFCKTNKDVMQFDCRNDIHKIVFNHYIMRKVNLHRMKGDLPNGQFKITIRVASIDLNLSRSTINRLIEEFEACGIISAVKKSSIGSGGSIYEYITDSKHNFAQKREPLNEPLIEPVDGPLEVSNFKEFNGFDEPLVEPVCEPLFGTSNIENLNREFNNNIYCRVIDFLNKKSGKRFRATTKKTKSLILARLNEDFVEEDFYKVINTKCEQWMGSEMEKFIRPETLFSNKFEGYLNERCEASYDEGQESDLYDIDFKF